MWLPTSTFPNSKVLQLFYRNDETKVFKLNVCLELFHVSVECARVQQRKEPLLMKNPVNSS